MTVERFVNRLRALSLIDRLLTAQKQFSVHHDGAEYIVSYKDEENPE